MQARTTRHLLAVTSLLLILVVPPALAQDPGSGSTATLRCDPGSRIDGIDGDKRYVVASYGAGFNDCKIELPPGRHVVKVCYEVMEPGFGVYMGADLLTCKQNQDLAFDAVAGGVYRIRMKLTRDWKLWIQDVTSTEADVPAPPTINKSRRDLPKDERKSMVLVRVLSEKDEPAFLKGEVQHVWFKMRDLHQAFGNPSKMRREKDGYFSDKFSNGDTIALHYMFHQEGSAFSRSFEDVCETPLPVYEDLPGGKVLYLGDYRFVAEVSGRRFTVEQDVEAARNFLRANYPQLVDKLVVADYRTLRSTELCALRRGWLHSAR
jgi:hypothetical protein